MTYIRATVLGSGVVAVARITVGVEVISLSIPETARLEINGPVFESQVLPLTIDPANATDQRVTWTTSNPNVVIVDQNGRITAIGGGQARVTVTSLCSGVQSSTLVTVIVRVTHVLVDQSEMFLVIDGNTRGRGRLNVTVLPQNATNRAVTFEGYDRNIISVSSDGWVTARDGGVTQVTVRSVCNDGIYSSTVVTVIVTAVGISLHPAAVSMTVSNTAITDQVQLRATVYPENATSLIRWISSNTSVVRVDEEGRLHAVRPGEATVTAWIDGRSASSRVIVEPEIVLKMDWGGIFVNGEVMYRSFPGATRVGAHMMAPISVLADATRGASSWSPETRTAQVFLDGRIFDFTIGSRTMGVRYNGQASPSSTVTLPAAPMVFDLHPGQVFVPVQAVFEAIGWNVYEWVGIPGQEYVLLTRMDLSGNVEGHWTQVLAKMEHARGPENWNLLPPTGIILQDAPQIEVGRPRQLNAVVLPAIERLDSSLVRWESDNPNIVRVDESGTATGVAQGRATITAINALDHRATIQVNIVPATAPPFDWRFVDVSTSASNWAFRYVYAISSMGIMQGDGSYFSPHAEISNIQIIATMHRILHGGMPWEPDWSAPYIQWAHDNNIILDVDGPFYPHRAALRQDIARYMHRFLGRPSSPNSPEWENVPDRGQIGPHPLVNYRLNIYNSTALRWAHHNGIIMGDGYGRINPQGQATRAEAAAMLVRLMRDVQGRHIPTPPQLPATMDRWVITDAPVRPTTHDPHTELGILPVGTTLRVVPVVGMQHAGSNIWYQIWFGNRYAFVHSGYLGDAEPPPMFDVRWPAPNVYRINFPFWTTGGGNHWAIDINSVREEVVAVASGAVEFRGIWGGGSGRTIRINHYVPGQRADYRSLYMHLEEYRIGLNVPVRAGQVIGISGDHESPDNFHLHFEIWRPGGWRSQDAFNPLECYHPSDYNNQIMFRHAPLDYRIPPNSEGQGGNPNPLFIWRDGRFVANPAFHWTRPGA